ncbi:hypothetical protein [Nocardia brasiliensis]
MIYQSDTGRSPSTSEPIGEAVRLPVTHETTVALPGDEAASDNQQITTSGTLHIDNECLTYEVRSRPERRIRRNFAWRWRVDECAAIRRTCYRNCGGWSNRCRLRLLRPRTKYRTLAELSLSRRRTQAIGVISALCDQTKPIVLVGFSMSGQTVCDVIASQAVMVRSAFLGCAAAYRPDVFTLPFGNPEFTE